MPEKMKQYRSLSACYRNGLKFFGLALVLVLYITVSIARADISSPIWLERKTISLRDMMQKKTSGEGDKKESREMERQSRQEDQQPKRKRTRSPMSRPAAYFVKSGDYPDLITDSSELLNTVCWLQSPDQSYKKLVPMKTDQGTLIFDQALQGGLYKIYLYHDAGMKNGIRYRHFSTHWFRNVGEDNFEIKPFRAETREGLHGEEPLFYLKELTKDNENNYVSLKRYTGDIFPLQVFFKGAPVSGVPVTLTTAKGWQKTVITDEQGKASFLLIKEIFHNDRIHKSPEQYLVKAVYTMDHDNNSAQESCKKEVYTATIALTVYPTPYDWKSKSAGFFIFTGSILAVMFAAAIRRKRSLSL